LVPKQLPPSQRIVFAKAAPPPTATATAIAANKRITCLTLGPPLSVLGVDTPSKQHEYLSTPGGAAHPPNE
jgi:hypothetical protein